MAQTEDYSGVAESQYLASANGNESENLTADSIHTNPGRDETLAKIEIATLSVILTAAIAGNSLMLVALRRQLLYRPMSRMYFFMINLSIADLLVAFGNILPQLAWDITYRFLGNDLLCRVVKFLQVFVLYLSTYVLTSMALDRYLVVCHQSFSRSYYGPTKGPKILVAASYILSFILACPQAFIFSMKEIVQPSGTTVEDCWVTFIEPWGAKAYVTFFVTCAFGFPLLVIGLSYGAICYKVFRYNLPKEAKKPNSSSRSAKKVSLSSSSEHRNRSEADSDFDGMPLHLQQESNERAVLRKQISQAKIKALKLTFVVVLCFFVCWAPFCITQILMAYGPHDSNPGPVPVILLLLASLNSCTNPWIYLAFSESLCNQLRVCFGMGLRRGSDEESIGDEVNERNVKKRAANKNVEMNPSKSIPLRNGVQTSIGRKSDQDVEQKPETKSDFL